MEKWKERKEKRETKKGGGRIERDRERWRNEKRKAAIERGGREIRRKVGVCVNVLSDYIKRFF